MVKEVVSVTTGTQAVIIYLVGLPCGATYPVLT